MVKTKAFAVVRNLLAEIETDRPPKIILSGEQGSGRYTLVSSGLSELSLSLTTVASGSPSSTRTTYYPIAGALASLLSDLEKHRILSDLAAAVVKDLARLLPILGQFVPAVINSWEQYWGSPPQVSLSDRNDILFWINKVLRKVTSRRNLLLVFRDVQGYDDSSLALIEYLAEQASRHKFALILTLDPTRPRAASAINLPELENALVERHGFIRVAVQPLERHELSRLATELIGNQISIADSKKLYELTGGNPLYATELVRQTLEEPRFAEAGDDLFGSYTTAQIPDLLRNRLDSRIRALQEEMRSIVDVASAVGYHFQPQPVAGILRVTDLELLRRLRELHETHRLIKQLDKEYQFTSRLVRDRIYDLLGPALARHQHLLLAQYYEQSESFPATGSYLIYEHYLKAGEHDKALRYLEKSAGEAAAMKAYEVAASRLQEVLYVYMSSSEVDPKNVMTLRLQLNEYLLEAGLFQKAALGMLELAQDSRQKDIRHRAVLRLAQAEYLGSIGTDQVVRRLNPLLMESPEPNAEIQARLLLASALYHNGDWETGRKHYRKCYRLLRFTSSLETTAHVRRVINMFYYPELAEPILRRTLDDSGLSPSLLAEIRHNLGTNYLFLRRFREAQALLEAARDYFTQAGSFKIVLPLQNLGILAMIRGDLLAAETQFVRIIDESVLEFDCIAAKVNLSIVRLLQGRPELGIEILNSFEERSVLDGLGLVLTEYVLHNLALAQLTVGLRRPAFYNFERSYPSRANPWVALKQRRARRLARKARNDDETEGGPRAEGRKDAWAFEELDYAFLETWFWE